VNQIRSGIGVPVGLTTAEADLAPRYGPLDLVATGGVDSSFDREQQTAPLFRINQQF